MRFLQSAGTSLLDFFSLLRSIFMVKSLSTTIATLKLVHDLMKVSTKLLYINWNYLKQLLAIMIFLKNVKSLIMLQFSFFLVGVAVAICLSKLCLSQYGDCLTHSLYSSNLSFSLLQSLLSRRDLKLSDPTKTVFKDVEDNFQIVHVRSDIY